MWRNVLCANPWCYQVSFLRLQPGYCSAAADCCIWLMAVETECWLRVWPIISVIAVICYLLPRGGSHMTPVSSVLHHTPFSSRKRWKMTWRVDFSPLVICEQSLKPTANKNISKKSLTRIFATVKIPNYIWLSIHQRFKMPFFKQPDLMSRHGEYKECKKKPSR